VEKEERFYVGKLVFRLSQRWLGTTKRSAFLWKNGEWRKIGMDFYGDGDIKQPFFRYLGAA